MDQADRLVMLRNGVQSAFWADLKERFADIEERLKADLLRMSLKEADILNLAELRAQYRLLAEIIQSVEGEMGALTMVLADDEDNS